MTSVALTQNATHKTFVFCLASQNIKPQTQTFTMSPMDKIRYINLCIVEFGRKFRMPINVAFNYLKQHKALEFIDRHYSAQHLLPLDDTLRDLQAYCRKNGGTI